MDGAEVPDHGKHDGQGHGCFRRREHDHERGHDLAVDSVLHVAGKGYEIDIGGVEHELDAHEDPDGIAARHHGKQAESEQHRTDGQEMRQPDVHDCTSVSPFSGSSSSNFCSRIRMAAPIMAASSTRDTYSNGKM